MANEMPDPARYTGLSRKVLEYSAAFARLATQLKGGDVSDQDWRPFEEIVDATAYERVGVFMGQQAEVIDWPTYKGYITQYSGAINWEGTLRHITESGKRVVLELEERNTYGGETDVSNTVTIYEFDEVDRLVHLDVYVMPLRKQPAG